jgi:thioredoxin-dependent peroxiredoxin
MGEIKVGDKIPKFSARAKDRFLLDNEDLVGKPFVLYFYPGGTPACLAEAFSFRDNMHLFEKLKVNVFAISPEDPATHKKFLQKYRINFYLLSDQDLSAAQKFGVALTGSKKGILRATFLVDAAGIVLWMEKPVNIEGHVERVLHEVNRLLNIPSEKKSNLSA